MAFAVTGSKVLVFKGVCAQSNDLGNLDFVSVLPDVHLVFHVEAVDREIAFA